MRQNEEKLKNLLGEIPHGFLVDAKTLRGFDIDHRLAHYYVKSGWLEAAARGVYRRPFIDPNWQKGASTDWRVTALSLMAMSYKVHVGGATALSLRGFDHYVPMGEGERVFLYGDDMPSWVRRVPTHDSYLFRTLNLFGGSDEGIEDLAFDATARDVPQRAFLSPSRYPMRVSDSERAILEMLKEVPVQESFHKVDTLFESLTSLRPARLEILLTLCRNVKVKRLFFVFADRHNHSWRKYVSPDTFDLGHGPRALVKGGTIHPHYKISVPEAFAADPDESNTDGP